MRTTNQKGINWGINWIKKKNDTDNGGSSISQSGVRQSLGWGGGGGTNLLFDQFFQKTAWKWRHFSTRLLDPPLTDTELDPNISCRVLKLKTFIIAQSYSVHHVTCMWQRKQQVCVELLSRNYSLIYSTARVLSVTSLNFVIFFLKKRGLSRPTVPMFIRGFITQN